MGAIRGMTGGRGRSIAQAGQRLPGRPGGGIFGGVIRQAMSQLAQTPQQMPTDQMPMAPAPQMPGPAYPAAPMQVPIQSQVLQPTATSQPQTMQGPAFLKQFGEGADGGLTMSAYNPRAQFDAAMYRRGGTPWQFASQAVYAPQTTQQMAQNFAQGTMQPQAMPQLSQQQMQALAQMIAGMIRM